jgi:hypothetical protein
MARFKMQFKFEENGKTDKEAIESAHKLFCVEFIKQFINELNYETKIDKINNKDEKSKIVEISIDAINFKKTIQEGKKEIKQRSPKIDYNDIEPPEIPKNKEKGGEI